MRSAGSSVDCSVCGRTFSAFGVARHRRSCGRRLRVATAMVLWGLALRGEPGHRANVFLALQRQLKAGTDFARCRYCGKTRQVCCGDGPGTPHREASCAKCCGPHPRNVVRLQTESSSPD